MDLFPPNFLAKGYDLEDANPSNVNYVAVGDMEIRASWTVSQFNCEVTGYKIRYREGTSGEFDQLVEVIGGAVDEYVIEGLRSTTTYSFEIAAVTSYGDLDFVGAGSAQTLDFDGEGNLQNWRGPWSSHEVDSTVYETSLEENK